MLFCFCICGRAPVAFSIKLDVLPVAFSIKLDVFAVAASRPLQVVVGPVFITLMLGIAPTSPPLPPPNDPFQGPDKISPVLAGVEDGGLKADCGCVCAPCGTAGLAVAERDKMSAVLTGFFWP